MRRRTKTQIKDGLVYGALFLVCAAAWVVILLEFWNA
jgi:hypothetical protein